MWTIQRNIHPKLLKYYKLLESRNRGKTFEETARKTGPEWPNKLSNCLFTIASGYCIVYFCNILIFNTVHYKQ